MVGDRRGYQVSIADGVSPADWVIFFPAEAIVDAELGVLLRLTCYVEGKPATRYELRDVSTEPGHPGDFRIGAPPGVPTEESDNPLADAAAGVPGPVKFAVNAARSLLDSLRGH
jgi:hypothetical protein